MNGAPAGYLSKRVNAARTAGFRNFLRVLSLVQFDIMRRRFIPAIGAAGQREL